MSASGERHPHLAPFQNLTTKRGEVHNISSPVTSPDLSVEGTHLNNPTRRSPIAGLSMKSIVAAIDDQAAFRSNERFLEQRIATFERWKIGRSDRHASLCTSDTGRWRARGFIVRIFKERFLRRLVIRHAAFTSSTGMRCCGAFFT